MVDQTNCKSSDESALYGDVTVKCYPWSERYTVDQYVKLLNTYSDHLELDEGTRQNLFVGVREAIEQYGGILEKPYLAVLYHAYVLR